MSTDNSSKAGFQRRLDLEGAPNIRDLGGYPTVNGAETQWGLIFRAGRLSALTERDKAQISRFNLRTICDFRRPDEYEKDVTDLGDGGRASIYNLAIAPGNQRGKIEDLGESQFSGDDMVEWMRLINRELALKQTDTYKLMFDLLLDCNEGAFLFHCSAGKDRTGFGAALILAALGVDRDTIMEDYLLTAQYYPPKGELEYLAGKYVGSGEVDLSVFSALMDTREEYLASAFEAIDENYESMDEYMERELGLTNARRQKLIDRYVS